MATEEKTMGDPTRIVQIAACMTRGDKRDFANVYGLDEQSRVWQWDPQAAKWKPFKVEKRAARRDDF